MRNCDGVELPVVYISSNLKSLPVYIYPVDDYLSLTLFPRHSLSIVPYAASRSFV